MRIWDPKFDNLLDGVESFFDELYYLEKHARGVIGDGTLVVSKEVDVQVLEKAEVDEVLKGSTVRLPFWQRFWRKNRGKFFIFISSSFAVALIWFLTVAIDADSPANQNLVNNMRLLIPASVAIALNYFIQMVTSISANKSIVTWALARNRKHSADV